MPYCSNCGTYVLEADKFCPRCGRTQQPGAAPAAGAPEAPAGPPPSPAAAASPPPPPTPPAPGAGASSFTRPQAPPTATICTNTAAALCYIPFVGWIAALIFLTLDPYRTNRYVRFHAFQGLYLAVLGFVAQIVFFPLDMRQHHFPGFPFWGDHHISLFPFFPFWGIRKIIQILVLIAQIMGIVKTRRNQTYRLPILGELAEKSMV
jgi:uncharacterized membrane protein